MQNVAMFGFYDAGNFGDDLMAVLLGCSLREAGVRCTTFGLDDETAREFGLPPPGALTICSKAPKL